MRGLLGDAATIFRREVLRYRRDRAYWLGQLVFPLVVVGFIGFGMEDVVRLPTGATYLAHLASGVLALLVGSGGVGAGFALIQERESGFLRALRIAPIAPGSVVLGKIAARFLVSTLLVASLLLLFAAFTALRPLHPGAVLLAVAGITAFFVALGIGLALRLRSLESFRVLSALVTVPLYFLSGIFYPIATLPAASRALAYANPLTYGVDLLRFGLLGVAEIPPLVSVTILVLVGVAGVTAATLGFERPARASRRRRSPASAAVGEGR